MCTSWKFNLLLYLLFWSGFQGSAENSAQSSPAKGTEIIGIAGETIISFAPAGLQTILMFIFEMLMASLFPELEEQSENTTSDNSSEEMLVHINKKFDHLSDFMNYQTGKITDTLINHFDKHNILDEALKQLNLLRIAYVEDFVPCIRNKICDENTRKVFEENYLVSEKLKLTKIIESFIVHHHSKDTGKRIFDVILESRAVEVKYISCADHYLSLLQNYIYDLHEYINSVIIQHYWSILYVHAQKYRRQLSGNPKNAERVLAQTKRMVEHFKDDVLRVAKAARSALSRASRDYILPCDPEQHIENVTYVRLTPFIQPYLIPNKARWSDHLDEAAEYDRRCYTVPEIYFDSRYNCQTFGRLINCTSLDGSVSRINYEAQTGHIKSFEVTGGTFNKSYGKETTGFSETLESYMEKINRKIGREIWMHHIQSRKKISSGISDLIFLKLTLDNVNRLDPKEQRSREEMGDFDICWHDSSNPDWKESPGLEKIDPSSFKGVRNLQIKKEIMANSKLGSTRRFNLRSVKASYNNVLTGVQFQVRKNTIYLQIQQGKLINGTIAADTVEWKEIKEDPTNDITLDVYSRSFNFDDVLVPKGSFLTGVQFEVRRGAIALGIYGLRVDNQGNLIYNEKTKDFHDYYCSSYSSSRSEIILDHPDASERAPGNIQHRILSNAGEHFVRFQPSDLEKDAGQTTVPYLDIQKVVSKYPTPLGGIGTYYKGMKGFGGFIGIRLISIDFSILLDENILESSFNSILKELNKTLGVEHLKN